MQEDTVVERHRPRAARVMFLVLLLGSLSALLYLLSSFITDAVLGFMLAGLSRPFYEWLCEHHAPPWVAAAIVSLLVAVAIAVPTVFLAASLTEQATRAYLLASASLARGDFNDALFGNSFWALRLREGFEAFGIEYSPRALRMALGDVARGIAGTLSTQINAAVSNVFGAIYHFVMLLVIVYYGLTYGLDLKQRIFDLSPLPNDEEQLIVDKFGDVGKAILFGNGIGSAAQGALGALSMWWCGISSPMFWGAAMTLCAFLPLVGISFVAVPVAVYLAVTGQWFAALAFSAFNLMQALIIENVVKTKLIGNRMHMNGALVFFSLLGGLSMFGVVGILYGPLILALFTTVHDLYERVYRRTLVVSERPPPRANVGR